MHVITQITTVETIYGRPGQRMAVQRRQKSVGLCPQTFAYFCLAYGLLAIRLLCSWRTAPLQLQLPLVALY